MTFRAVLFDLDGTLLNSIDGIVECFELVLAEYQPGHKFSRHDYEDWRAGAQADA